MNAIILNIFLFGCSAVAIWVAWKLREGIAAPAGCHLVMDQAYEGDEPRNSRFALGFVPVVPHPNRLHPWSMTGYPHPPANQRI